jgi:hypothetical protein
MDFDPLAESQLVQQADNRNRSLIIFSWVLIGLVCLISLVPFFGFGLWLIAGPILFIALVMGIIILARGETLPGLAILLTSLIAAPLLIVAAPFVSSLFGLGGTAPAIGTAAEAATQINPSPTTQSRPLRAPDGGPQSSEFEQLKTQIQGQSEQVAELKSKQLITEGVYGRLVDDERLTMEQRVLVQRENFYRERIFDMIGRRTGHSREEIAAIFAKLAQRSAVDAKPPPAN